MGHELDDKLADFDRHADLAVTFIIQFLEENRDYVIAQARGRLIEGHWRYRDKLMYELSPDELLAEMSQEQADAVNYIARRMTL